MIQAGLGIEPDPRLFLWFLCRACLAGQFLDTFAGLPLVYPSVNSNNEEDGGDAFKHCVLSCLAAQRCGAECAGRLDGREDPKSPGGQMDLANNKSGRAGANSPSCGEFCMDSWKAGGLTCKAPGNKNVLRPCPPPC